MQKLKLWLEFNPGLAGVLLIAAVGGLLALAYAVFSWPIGPPQIVSGRLETFGFRERDEGSFQVAVIRLGDAPPTVRIPANQNCRVGDTVSLVQQRHLWGNRFRLVASPSACVKPTA
jgi:hypothetical protein